LPPPEALREALFSKKLLEGRDTAKAGELAVGDDLPGIGEAFIEGPAQVIDGQAV